MIKNLCKFCNKIFASRSSLWNHQNKDPATSICSYHKEEEKRGRRRPPKLSNKQKPKVDPPHLPSPSREFDVSSESEQSDVEGVESLEVVFKSLEKNYTTLKDEHAHLQGKYETLLRDNEHLNWCLNNRNEEVVNLEGKYAKLE